MWDLAGVAHQVAVDRLDRAHDAILLPDRLADNLGLGNLLLVRRGLLERFRQCFLRELPDSRADIERFDAFGPESLIAEEGLDDGGLTDQLDSQG